MTDLNFAKILDELRQIHESFPDLRFGEVIQQALDLRKNLSNVNLNHRSSKEILQALEEYHVLHAKKRGVKK